MCPSRMVHEPAAEWPVSDRLVAEVRWHCMAMHQLCSGSTDPKLQVATAFLIPPAAAAALSSAAQSQLLLLITIWDCLATGL